LKLLKEIQSTSQLLNRTSKDKIATLDRYMALQQQIAARQELIETLHAELEYAEESLERTSNVVFSLEDDMTRLEKEYGILARNAFRQKMNNSSLLFIFSAADFNQAFQRWQYLKQFNAYRKRQATLIVETQERLKEKMTILEERKQEKEHLLHSTEEQKTLLAEELNDKSSLLASLQKDESRLQKELTKQQDAHKALNDAIEEVIQKEVLAARKRERSREEALKNANSSTKITRPNPRPERTPETNVSSANFVTNKGKLPWPVTNGVIVKRFGKQPHPTLKRVEITNNGIDIQTSPNAQVRAVFEGLVVGKQFIPGYDNMLIIKHGNYYTVYSNLKEVYVKKDDTVKTRQAIGIASQKGNISQVHFEVWQDKVRLNPASWIYSK
jgi:murein hydrolase activator